MGSIAFRYFILIILFFLISGCLEDTEPNQPTAFRVGLHHSIDHINVFTQSTTDFWKVQTYLFERLLRRDPVTGEITSNLAESWDWSKNNKILEMRLRPGLKWSDGEVLNADDVIFSLEAHDNPEYRSLYMGIFSQLLTSFKKVNDLTLQFEFKKISFSNLKDLGLNLFIYPEHIYSTGKRNRIVATNGAYQLKEFQPGKVLRLIQNPYWHGRNLPELKTLYSYSELEFHSSNGEKNLFEMLERNQIDYFQSLDPKSFHGFSEKLKKSSSTPVIAVRAEGYKLLGIRVVSVNHNTAGLSDLAVRKALMHCFDRDHVNEKFFYGLLQPAKGPWSLKHPLAAPEDNVKEYEFNISKANNLLDRSGWEINPKSGVREKSIDGKVHQLIFEFLDYDKGNEPLLTLFKESAKKVGIRININITGFSEAMRLLKEKKFDLAFHQAQWIPKQPNLRYWYFSAEADNPYLNVGSYKDPVLDEWILKLESAMDDSQRKQLYQKAYVHLSQQMPDLYWFHDRYVFYLVNKRVVRQKDSLAYDIGLSTWSLKK